jgi:hypothetical protein
MEMIQLGAQRNARTERAGNIWTRFGAMYCDDNFILLRTCLPVAFDEHWLEPLTNAGWSIEREEVEISVVDRLMGTALKVPPDWFDFWAEEVVLG